MSSRNCRTHQVQSADRTVLSLKAARGPDFRLYQGQCPRHTWPSLQNAAGPVCKTQQTQSLGHTGPDRRTFRDHSPNCIGPVVQTTPGQVARPHLAQSPDRTGPVSRLQQTQYPDRTRTCLQAALFFKS
ncbi:hypothetical protein chiPu_0025572 [Chiloscyllium punctatum]|uniref:Uncharacterized protein n=1 Tax=Chiloscyllium punctatum TaxID=137246 RepID=A0A401TG70_CHIPU|nr:hypothetical protein [Chiloscyllium punctatum]